MLTTLTLLKRVESRLRRVGDHRTRPMVKRAYKEAAIAVHKAAIKRR